MIDDKADNAKSTIATDTLPSQQGKGKVAVDQERAKRLREARVLAGYDTAADAKRAYGWRGSTYHQHESGLRGITNKKILSYASAFRVKTEWLLSGQGVPRTQTRRTPVEGIVGMYGVVDALKETHDRTVTLGDVELPPAEGREFMAFRVKGDGNYPAFFDGDVLYTERPVAPSECIGKQCIVTLRSGERRLCLLTRGAGPAFLLVSFNASPMPDADVIEAAPVIWIKRG